MTAPCKLLLLLPALLLLGGCAAEQIQYAQPTTPPQFPLRQGTLPGCPFPTIEILNADSLLLCGSPTTPGALIRTVRSMRQPPRIYVLVSPRTSFGDLVAVVYRFYEAGVTSLSLTTPPVST